MTLTEELLMTQQERLAFLGWYRSRIDGKDGPATQMAFSRFKAAHGFPSRPFPGPQTMGALWGASAKFAPTPVANGLDPAWLTEARTLLGVKEMPGAGNNPVIMQWARDLDQWYPGDDLPWCGLFVGHCMSAGAPDEPQNFNRLGARAWSAYGVECGEWLGAVVRFWRTHKTQSSDGHVALLTGVSTDYVRVIGGNQSDSVTEMWLPRGRVLGYCGPTGWSGSPAPRDNVGVISTKES